MQSVIFLWFLWGLFIISAFLMEKGVQRSRFMFAILILIFFAGYTIPMYSFHVNTAIIALLIWGYSTYKNQSILAVLTLILSNLTITLLYDLIQIYWLMDPAIFLILKKWMFIVFLTIVLLAIVKSLKLRISTAIIGVCQGDILHSFIFYPYDIMIGGSDCFNTVTISVLVILAWSCFQWITQKMQDSMSRQMNERLTK